MGYTVHVQRDHFPEDADDPTILGACGANGWIYVAQDFAVRKNPAELQALINAGIHAIFLRGNQKPAEWVIANLRASNARIVRTLSEATSPMHIELQAEGRIKVLAQEA